MSSFQQGFVQGEAIILAAGKGTRMLSDKPKVLHKIAGRTMLEWQLMALQAAGINSVRLVVGHKAVELESFAKRFHPWVNCVRQAQQLGTGHAAKIALTGSTGTSPVIVISGDIPFIHTTTLVKLLQLAANGKLALVTTKLDNPEGYGRVLRLGEANVETIVEERDADTQTKKIKEVFCGILAAPQGKLESWLGKLNNANSQQEYYLPEIVSIARSEETQVQCVEVTNTLEVSGVNSLAQLITLERSWMEEQLHLLIKKGVYVADPKRTDLRGEIICGKDVRIDPNCIFEGRVTIENGAHIGANSVLIDCHIGANTRVEPFCHIENSWVGDGCSIGPFARLRRGTKLEGEVKIGNFVEVKKSTIAKGSKTSHLAYLGDATIGENVNVGAGTITCNYDGYHKHKTKVGDGVFLGSNCSLVAPVSIGSQTIVGAGSVITENVPDKTLALARQRQVNKPRQ